MSEENTQETRNGIPHVKEGRGIASVKVKAGTAFGDFSGKVKNAAGVKDLKVVLDKGDVEIDYVKFKK
jgi:hypothetical protein